MAAAKWSDVEANPKYQALSDAGKAELKVRYWNNVVGADPRLKSLSDDGVAQLHKRFFGVLPGEVTQTDPQDDVDRTDRGIGSDLAGAWTVGANSLVAGAGWALKAAGADEAGQAVMNVGEKGMKAGRNMMSKEGIEAGKKKFLTTNWDESVLTHPRALAMAAVESLPGMVIPMGATAVVARTAAAQAAKKAAAIAAKRGASAAVTDRFAAKAAAAAMKKAVIPASIVGEVAVSASGVGQQTYSEVMGMKPEDLDKSQTYRDTVNHYIDNGLSEEEARGMAQEAVAMSASRIAAAVSAPASALAGYVGGKWMGHVLGEAPAGVGKEAVRGAITEVAQEVPQSAAEQFGQNAGVKMRADETRSLGKDVAEAAAMGGLVAGPMGGAMGALHGLGGKGNEKPAPSSQPAGDQPNNPAADIPSDALRQHAADLGDSEWDAQSRDEINAELVRRGEQPVESITPPQDAAPEAGQQEPPASAEPAAPATNEVPGHVGYDLDQMNTQQPVAPAPGLGGIADRAQAQTAAQPVEPPSANVDPKTGEVIDELPALNDTQLVKEVRALMANGEPPLAKEIAEKFGIDRDRAGRVLNAAWAVQRQSQVAAPATADVTPQAPPAVANLGQQPAMAVPAPAEFPTMHLAQQALATGGQAETHRVVPKGARFVIEPKPAAQPEAVADVSAVEQPTAPAVAEQRPVLPGMEETERDNSALNSRIDQEVANDASGRTLLEKAFSAFYGAMRGGQMANTLVGGGILDNQHYRRLPAEIQRRSAHGMAKDFTLASLRSLLTTGIEAGRGRSGGSLDTAPLSSASGDTGGGGTGSGNAYSEGSFTLVAREGVGAITNMSQVEAVVVNSAIPDAVVRGLRETYPDMQFLRSWELGALESKAAPTATPAAASMVPTAPAETQQDPVAAAKAALAAHRTTNPAKGQGKAWAEQEKALQKAIRSARKTANAAPAAQQPVAAPELPEINFRADREAAGAATSAAEAPAVTTEEHRSGQRKAPVTAKDAYHEAVAAQVRHEDDESPTLSGLPVDVRRRIHEERVAAKMKAKPLPLDPTSGLINGKEVLNESITEEGTSKGTMLEAIFSAAISHVKAGGTAHVSELDLGNLGGINHFAGQVGGDRAIAGVSKAISGAVEAAGHGDKIELSRYGGDEFFSTARDLDVETIGRTLDAANAAAQDYMDKTTPRMLNPNLETSIRQDKTLSEEEKAVVLSHMDTPLSHLPKKPAKGADGKTFYGPGNTKLHVGKQVQVTADVSAADLHQEADSSLAAAKNANYKEGGRNERKTDELEGLRRDGQHGAQAPAAGEVGAGGSKPDSDETGSGAVVGRSATGGAVDSAVARGAGERGGQQDGVKPAAGATPADGKAAPKKSSGATTATTAKPEQPASKIEDFGETLHGARKHYAQAYKDQIAASESVDMAVEPLSKSWPEPDYQKLLDDGVDPWVVAFVRVNRDAVPTKPKKGWKLQGWAAGANALRDSAHKALRGEYTVEQMKEQLAKDRFNRLSQKISGVIDLYIAVGHEKSLKGIDFSLSHYSLHGGVKYSPAKAIWAVSRESKSTAFGNWPTELAIGDTREEAIAAFKAKYATMDAPAAKKAEVKFTIYSRTTDDPRKFYIGKKVGKTYFDLKSFATSKEARDFLEGNHDELVRLLANNKEIPPERRETNDPRVGVDHRSGADVTSEQFSETFGFRGVQFGNYVEGPRRQQDLNNAYDALMDLAGVIGVPPKALSLNGELGLAFGARGKGGARPAAAHYESDTVVINLTKGAGAGSLAHEWWHSVDNYFSRMRQGSGRHYMTDARDVSLAARGSNFVAAPGVRKEVVQAFGDIMRGINRTSVKERSKNLDARRTKAYWSTDIEMSARAFESYVIAKLQDQGASNDYLANIVSEAAWSLEEGYPYPTAGEIADIRAGFDTFFGVVQTKETDKGVAMFSIGQGGKVGMPASTIRNMVDRMKAGSAGIVVRQSAKDLPRAVLDAADKQGIPHDKIRGVHFGGISYLVADNMTAKEVQAVVFHEAYTHGGLRSRYEGRVEGRMIDLANNLQGGGKPHVRVMRLAKQQGISLLAYERGLANDGTKTERQKLAVLTEELMAHIGETTGSLRAYLEEVVGMIRKFLRDVGLSDLSEMGITDIRAELRMAREAYLNQASNASGEPAFSRRGWSQDFPDAILGMDSATAQAHPDYAAAKAGDDAAALRLARDLVTPEYVESIKAVLGDKKPTIVPVLAVESMGKNRIPVMVANVLGERLGLPVTEDIIQSKKVGRSAGDGFHRLATKVTFSGPVKPGDYLILDDTLTQGGTLAELKTHIEDAGGHVVLASALTGKQYSRKLALSSDTLGQLRERFGSIENWWRDTFGHDFSGLTESEGRFLLKLKGSPRPDAVRDRILAARDEGLRGLGARDDSHGPDQQPVDDVSFSLRGESGKAQTSTVTNLRAWLRNQLAIRTQSSRTFNLLWHRGVGTQYHKGTIDKHYKLVYDIGQEYLNGVARNAADSMEAAPTLLGRMDGFKDWWRDAKSSVTSSQDKKDLAAIAGPIFDGTLKDKKQYTDQELKKQFGLNDKQVGLYREFRNAVEVSLHSLAKAEIFDRLKASKSLPKDVLDTLRDMDVDMDTFTKHIRSEMAKHLKAHAGDADVKKAVASGLASTKEINERINNLLSEGYAPLMRFGEYTVTVKDKAGKIEHFSMHESQADANAAKAALEKAVPKSYTVESGVMAEGENEIFKGISPETIALFGEAAGITKDEAYQEYLKKAIANRSALKRLIHRKEVPGFDKDVQRVLASFVTSNARRAAKLTHLDQLDEAIEAIPQKKGDVKTEAIKFRKYMLDTGNEAQKFRSLLFTYYITGSIASAAVNMTQPVTMTFPYLSQWGSARAAKELARATKDGVASFGGTVPADLESAYNRAKRDGVVDPQNIFNMMAMAEGTLTAEGAASRSLKALNHSLAIAFSSAEALNRKSAFIAAFRIGRDLNKAQMEKAGVSSAYEFAVKAVAETQGIYNRGNRPNIGRGAVGATVMTFKQFSISYVELLRRLWKDDKGSFLIAIGILQMLAGVMGLPFADDIEDVVGSAMSRIGFGENPESKLRDVAQETFGDQWAEFMLYGSSAVLPIDVHGRLGMGNLLPATGVANKFNSPAQQTREMLEIAGVAGGLAQSVTSGQAVPTFARNAAKGAEMIATGEYRDTKGRKVMDATVGEGVAKMLGFQPSSVARETRALGAEMEQVNAQRVMEAKFADRRAQAIVDGDGKALKQVLADTEAWNERNPKQRIVITGAQITKRVREMKKSREERFLKRVPKEMRGDMRERIAQ